MIENRVSLVPKLNPTSPGAKIPVPINEAGLSPVPAET